MKLIFKRSIIIISLLFLLILSFGFVSASDILDESSDSNSISYNENLISQDSDNLFTDDLSSKTSNSNKLESSDSGNNDNFTHIQALIDNADENDIVSIDGNYCGSSQIVINKTITLSGGSYGATLDGMFLTKILEVNAPNVTIRNIKFINSYDMSVTLTKDNITIENCSFENSINGELGSALSCNGNYLTVRNSSFLNNIANKSSCHHTDGPAIHLIGNHAIIDNCLFVNNSGYNYETSSSGGAIWLKGQYNSITNSIFINNSASSKYGWTWGGDEQTYLAEGNGGSIYWVGNKGEIVNCSFINSVSHAYGGAIYYKAADGCSIINSSFINSFSVSDGGAIYLGSNVYNLNIENSSFVNNTAQGLIGLVVYYHPYGGAIYGGKYVENIGIFNSSFLDNYGFGVIHYSGSNLTVENSIIEGFNRTIENSTFNESSTELVIFTNGSLNANFWGRNFNSSDEIKESGIICSNGEYMSPDNWVNLNVQDLGFENENDEYFALNFINVDDSVFSAVDGSASANESNSTISMPIYKLKVAKTISNNEFLLEDENIDFVSNSNDYSEFYLENTTVLIYRFNDYGWDDLYFYNNLNELICSKSTELGVIYVNDTGNDTKDIQDAIDAAKANNIICLSNRNYSIDTIIIDKNVFVDGGSVANISSLDGSRILFKILSKEDNADLTYVGISGINFMANNGDILVLANAVNDSKYYLIDLPNISISNNNVFKASEDVVPESVTLLKLNSSRAVLAPTGTISINNNTLESGVKPFVFEVSSIYNGSDVKIDNSSFAESRKKSLISTGDMNVTAFNYNIDGRIGEYFKINLSDEYGNPLVNKTVMIGFNGKTYNRTTDEAGLAQLQVNLGVKGGYTFAVCFLGDDEYNASFAVNKITVLPQSPKITASNATYKASAKTKTIKAVFKTAAGNAISGKKISFTLNGKTYTAKTDSKGMVKVKVSISKKGTYKFTAKYSGDNTYKTMSSKGWIVIK